MRAESAVATPHSSLPAAALVRAAAECVCALSVQGGRDESPLLNGMEAGGCPVGWARPCLQNKQIRVGPRIDFCCYTFLALLMTSD